MSWFGFLLLFSFGMCTLMVAILKGGDRDI